MSFSPNVPIQIKRNTSEVPTSASDVLASGELFFDSVTKRIYVGDGETTLGQAVQGVDSALPVFKHITISDQAPSASDGFVGDIWLQYLE